MVYDDTKCFYVVSAGKLKIHKNGDLISTDNFSSNKLNDCLDFIKEVEK